MKQGAGPVEKIFAKKLDGAREERERGVFMAPEHHPATFKVKFS